MVTIERLRQIAALAAQAGDASQRQQAELCIEWMAAHALQQVPSIGPFGSSGAQPGDLVRLARGALVEGDWSREMTAKSYRVRLANVLPGYASRSPTGAPLVVNERVQWSGRYGWCWTESSNIRVVHSRRPIGADPDQDDFFALLALRPERALSR